MMRGYSKQSGSVGSFNTGLIIIGATERIGVNNMVVPHESFKALYIQKQPCRMLRFVYWNHENESRHIDDQAITVDQIEQLVLDLFSTMPDEEEFILERR